MMTPYYKEKWVTIYLGDCRELLPELDRVSAIVTDPPYELGFMGKSWDKQGVSFQKETWQIIREACLSGAPLLSFGGTRTFHRIACAIEDAGWEIRDTLMWVYGSGFPKSYDIAKGIEGKLTQGSASWNKWRNLDGEKEPMSWGLSKGQAQQGYRPNDYTEANQERVGKVNYHTSEAQLWEGYGTALKPAYEPIILAMNPLDGTFANNALKYGVAGLNIDGCRVEMSQGDIEINTSKASIDNHGVNFDVAESKNKGTATIPHTKGRFPANFIHDGSQQVMELFPQNRPSSKCDAQTGFNDSGNVFKGALNTHRGQGYYDNGSAARFFYCAKSSKAERNKGCEELDEQSVSYMNTHGGNADKGETWHPVDDRTGELRDRFSAKMRNTHPTVKPLALMEYLVKLVKMPEYNLIIDPFMGSGTTLLACIRLGIPCIGIDNDEKSCEITAKRCSQEVMELNI